MAKRRIVLTGACGYVAQRMWKELMERYDVVALDCAHRTSFGIEVPEVQLCDLADHDRNAYRHFFAGADAVVHCAYIPAPGMTVASVTNNSEVKFRVELANIELAYNVLQTALEEGVGRVVVTSSNHATDYYERLIWADRWDVVTPDIAPLSDNFYGWSKATYEHLGFIFATGKVGGRQLEVVQLRIGGPRDTADLEELRPGEVQRMHRGLGAFLSQRDQVQLYVKSIEAPDIRDANGIPFQIFYGVSGNSHNFWSLVNARRVIDYLPQDNSQILFADKIAEISRLERRQ